MKKIKSLNLMVTNRCNGACNMCNIWKDSDFCELDLNDVIRFLQKPELSEVEDLSISGGEPILRSDIDKFSKKLINALPKLEMLFVNTNGLLPEKTFKLAETIISESKSVNRNLEIFFSISIEGPKDIHELIRGRSYDQSIKTISLLKKLMSDKFKLVISMTVQRGNFKFINETRELAKFLGCGFSFRFADFSDNYYNNSEKNNISLARDDALIVMDGLKDKLKDDRFFQVLYKSVCERSNDVMIGRNDELICEAGSLFIFVKSNGMIYPCIYSEQVIGNLKDGLFSSKLNRVKSCPCCTECHIYPMINFSKKYKL